MTRQQYEPLVLADTAQLARPDWLELRKKGLGGSDAAAVLGISPFRTARDLYYDKLGIVTADDQANWVALEVGTLLEPLVARIFEAKTGLKVYQRKCMFQHPLYPWMLADLDYLVDLPDGTTAIVEIKTTTYNAKDKWWYNGEEIVPVYYESQGRHYMAVMNLDRVYYCCLYGNNEDEAIVRHIDRDMAYEAELIALEQDFWHENVLARLPPPYTEDGDLILESLRTGRPLSGASGGKAAAGHLCENGRGRDAAPEGPHRCGHGRELHRRLRGRRLHRHMESIPPGHHRQEWPGTTEGGTS